MIGTIREHAATLCAQQLLGAVRLGQTEQQQQQQQHEPFTPTLRRKLAKPTTPARLGREKFTLEMQMARAMADDDEDVPAACDSLHLSKQDLRVRAPIVCDPSTRLAAQLELLVCLPPILLAMNHMMPSIC